MLILLFNLPPQGEEEQDTAPRARSVSRLAYVGPTTVPEMVTARAKADVKRRGPSTIAALAAVVLDFLYDD